MLVFAESQQQVRSQDTHFKWKILRWSLKVDEMHLFSHGDLESFGVYKCCTHAHPSLSLKKPDLAQVNTGAGRSGDNVQSARTDPD